MRNGSGTHTFLKNQRTVAVSGGFDPLHIGHLRMIHEARKLGDRLVVILNNDNWLLRKKGFTFMPELERAEIVASLSDVDFVYVTKHGPNDPDATVCEALRELVPDVFANGGDRKPGNVPEDAVCEELGIQMVYIKEKTRSSSDIVGRARGFFTEERPWGSMTTFEQKPGWWVKTLTLKPRSRISLQSHLLREELWMCVEGEGIAEINDEVHVLKPGVSVEVPYAAHHRLSTFTGVKIVEVVHGKQADEKDIVRLEDDYGRS